VFRAEKASRSYSAYRARCGSRRARSAAMAWARPRTTVPAGSAPTDESAGMNRPFTNTRRWAGSSGKSYGARASAGGAPGASWARRKRVSAMGATLVKRQSSSRVVGKPRAAKRASARSRSGWSHAWPSPPKVAAKRVNASR